jgi:hypothetical protein
MRQLAHIVNPVQASASSDLYVAQPITFETMRIAQAFAATRVQAELWSAQYPEDQPVVPAGFAQTPDLETSVLDHGNFQKPRKLPLLKDILDRLYEATDAEYLVYTNVDIGLLPHFYLAVDRFIAAGYDAFVINRRTISRRYTSVAQIPLMYAEIGEPHRGWDCFVFKRDAYPRYELGTICVGAPRVGLALIGNLVAHARRFHEFKWEHLTFHLGDDRSWRGSVYADYAEHNSREVMRILAGLEDEVGPFSRSSPPGAFLRKRRMFGPAYEFWTRYVHIPLKWRRMLIGAGSS